MTQKLPPTIEKIIELFGGEAVIENQDDLDRPDDSISKSERLHAVIGQYRYPGDKDFRIRELVALLDEGANINARNEQGETLLLYAIENDWHFTPYEAVVELFWDTSPDHGIVRFLLQRGANVNLADRSGRTPLHLAASKGYLDLILTLLDKGADVEARDGLGRTPRNIAAEVGQTEVMELLLEFSGSDTA